MFGSNQSEIITYQMQLQNITIHEKQQKYLQRHPLTSDPYRQTHWDEPSKFTHFSFVELQTRIPFEHSSMSISQFVPFHPDLHVHTPVTSSQLKVLVTLHVHVCEHCDPNVVAVHAVNYNAKG